MVELSPQPLSVAPEKRYVHYFRSMRAKPKLNPNPTRWARTLVSNAYDNTRCIVTAAAAATLYLYLARPLR